MTSWRDQAHALEDFCAPRIFVKATCSAFQPELEALEKKGRLHALRAEKYPLTGQSPSLGKTGYVDDSVCHLLGAGVCEPERWRPLTLACGGQSGDREGTEQPAGPNRQGGEARSKAGRTDATPMESEEDAWAGRGMDEAEEAPLGTPMRKKQLIPLGRRWHGRCRRCPG